MVDATFACLMVNIKVLQVVVKVDTSSTEVSAKESSMGGEDGGHVNVSLAAEWNGKTCLPLVKVGYDRCVKAA